MEAPTIGGVLGDAWGSFRRKLGTHAAWNAVCLGIAFAGSCCIMCLMIPVVGAATLVTEHPGEDLVMRPVLVALMYAALLVGMLVLFAWHQGTVYAITRADLIGEPVGLTSAGRSAAARLVALVGALFLRLVIDCLGALPMCGVVYAMLPLDRLRDGDGSPPEAVVGTVGAVLAAYVAWLAWMIASRAFFGLSGPVAQAEDVGPLEAMRRSFELLSGHRLRFIAVRVVWAFLALVLYLLAYAPVLLLAVLAQDDGWPTTLLFFPYVLVFYYFAMHVLSFDAAIEAAFYARLTGGQSVKALASVFE